MKNNLLKDLLTKLDISYTDDQLGKFDKYYELLIDWNKKFNLTAITEYEDVVIKHFTDSILVCRYFDFNNDSYLIDVGTGAGFPGIPIKIMNPGSRIVLLDSLNKRIRFLEAVIDELELENIKCIHGRAEDVAREKEYRGRFDFALSRAVANLSTLSEYCIPFLKPGGCFISYKSDKSDEEIDASKNALKCLNSELTSIEETKIPDTDIRRRILVITNNKSVSNKYPRKAGIPSKEPL